jgi:hypothetical protein
MNWSGDFSPYLQSCCFESVEEDMDYQLLMDDPE